MGSYSSPSPKYNKVDIFLVGRGGGGELMVRNFLGVNKKTSPETDRSRTSTLHSLVMKLKPTLILTPFFRKMLRGNVFLSQKFCES